MQKTKHADAILALPAAQHPKLAALAQRLASDPRFTKVQAEDLLKAAAKDARVSKLDIEMCQPGNAVDVPFAAQGKPQSRDEQFQSMVNAHVGQIMKGR